MGRRYADAATRFRGGFTVNRRTDCWIWQRSTDNHGIPRFRGTDGNLVSVRRYSLTLAGIAPREFEVAIVTCADHRCVNPKHLAAVDKSYAATKRRQR